MKLTHLIRSSVTGLTAHKSRSFLTVLGIVIGITAIILIMSLGAGAQELILGQVQSIGSRTIAIVPGREPHGPADFLSTFTDSLKERDLGLLENKSNAPYIAHVMPIVFGSLTAAYGSETYRPTIFGAGEIYTEIYNTHPSEGRSFSDDEIKSYADVAVIGSEVKTQLFGNDDALGKKIKIHGRNFTVIGIFGDVGQLSFLDFNKSAFVPYTTAQEYIFGKHYFDRIVVQADTDEHVLDTVADVKATLRTSHGVTDPDKDDFFVQTQAEALQTVGTILSVLTLFLTAVAAISLVVGGIGIMNIMLVSVTERTREIGLRKALGATDGNILSQFLLESVMLTVVGGVIGIALGALLSFGITQVLSHGFGLAWSFTLPLNAIFLGLGVSSAIGVVFGIYPARQASKKSPIEALRYE